MCCGGGEGLHWKLPPWEGSVFCPQHRLLSQLNTGKGSSTGSHVWTILMDVLFWMVEGESWDVWGRGANHKVNSLPTCHSNPLISNPSPYPPPPPPPVLISTPHSLFSVFHISNGNILEMKHENNKGIVCVSFSFFE